MSPKPVFFDPQERRHKRVGLWAAAFGLLLAIVTTAVILSFSVVPLLPKVKGLSNTLHRPSHLVPRLPDSERRQSLYLARKAREELNKEIAKEKKRAETLKAPKGVPEGSPIVAAFYAPYQEVGITSFRAHARALTHIFPVWLHLDSKNLGTPDFSDFDPKLNWHNPDLIEIARQNGVHIWPVITNGRDDMFDRDEVRALLDSPASRRELVDNLVLWLKSKGFDGLNIDFEDLYASDYARLPAFLAELRTAFKPYRLGLSIDVEAARDEIPVTELAKNVDLVVAMLYDQHFQGGEPGPIAGVDWSDDRLAEFAKLVPANKLVLGVGSYAYDWPAGQPAQSISYQAALKAAQGYRDDEAASDVLEIDPTSLNTHFDYEDDGGVKHQVWMLDGISAYNQWTLAADMHARGTALWMLGTEDPSLWRFLNKDSIQSNPDPNALETVEFGPDDLEFVGSGDVLYAKGTLTSATRKIEVDKDSGLITDATLNGYPSGYYVQKSGYAGPKTLTITFDDGPDPTWTPQILEVLKRYGVKATFFVIGRNAEANPDVLRQVYRDGNEVGSHTFNHPNLDETTDRRTELELNATQRAIQGILGRTTALFRPPFNADSEPTSIDDVRPILLASKLGYVTVGESIDPQDWRIHENADDTGALRTPDEIAQAVLFQLAQKDHGNTILFHDGGGNRSATVGALKILIPELQKRGYKLVPVSAMLGMSRDAVMPPISAKDQALIGLDQFAFTTVFTFEWLLRLAFLAAIGLGLARVILSLPLALIHNRRRPLADPGFAPTVSVMIAAYNEEKVIARTVRSILDSKAPISEVIVVDDGSQDSTFLEVVTQFAGDSRVVVLKQENEGKASALNRALAQARGEILVCVDADTQLDPEAIGLLARHFQDRQIAAVAGNVKVGNRVNLLTQWQSIEYITSQNLDRRAYALANGIAVCPGAIGAWRRTALIEAGGYLGDTLAEDMDLTWRLRRAGWKVETESAAIAYTEAPDSLRGFFRQRFRWAYGTLQCLWKHRRALGRHGFFGWVTLPGLWLFQIVFNVLAPLVDLQLFYTAALFLIAWIAQSEYSKDWRPVADVSATLYQVAFLYGLFFAVELVSGLVAYRLDRERARSLWWLFLQRFVYRQIMYAVVWKALAQAIRGRRQAWGKVERKATVESPPPEKVPLS